MQTIRKTHQEFTLFTIDVIAMFTGVKIKSFIIKLQDYKDELRKYTSQNPFVFSVTLTLILGWVYIVNLLLEKIRVIRNRNNRPNCEKNITASDTLQSRGTMTRRCLLEKTQVQSPAADLSHP